MRGIAMLAIDGRLTQQGADVQEVVGYSLERGFAHCTVPAASDRPNSEVIWGTDDVCTSAEIMQPAAATFPNAFSEDEKVGHPQHVPTEVG